MAKQITLSYEGKDYTLEFTRRTVAEMEQQGFVAAELGDKPASMLPQLFAGAFRAHHRFVKPEVIEEIYKNLTGKEELIGKLAEMYNEPIAALLAEPEKAKGNLNWTAAW